MQFLYLHVYFHLSVSLCLSTIYQTKSNRTQTNLIYSNLICFNPIYSNLLICLSVGLSVCLKESFFLSLSVHVFMSTDPIKRAKISFEHLLKALSQQHVRKSQSQVCISHSWASELNASAFGQVWGSKESMLHLTRNLLARLTFRPFLKRIVHWVWVEHGRTLATP